MKSRLVVKASWPKRKAGRLWRPWHAPEANKRQADTQQKPGRPAATGRIREPGRGAIFQRRRSSICKQDGPKSELILSKPSRQSYVFSRSFFSFSNRERNFIPAETAPKDSSESWASFWPKDLREVICLYVFFPFVFFDTVSPPFFEIIIYYHQFLKKSTYFMFII